MAKCTECFYGNVQEDADHNKYLYCTALKFGFPLPKQDHVCDLFRPDFKIDSETLTLKGDEQNDPVNSPSHYVGKIECIDYLRDKLTQEEFTGFCMGNVLKYSSRWRKKDGLQDLKKAKVYLDWAIENEEKHTDENS